jgi:O-antigen ligase
MIKKRKRIVINLKSVLLILGVLIIFIVASSNLFKRVEVEVQKTKIHEVLNKESFGHVYIWTGFGLRIFQVKAFIEILQEQEKIFLGTGLNNSQNSLNNKYKEYNFYPGFLNYNYHNQYVQVFAELGLIGFCIFVLIFVLILKEAIVKRNYFLASFILLLLAVCVTESFLWRQRGMVFFITISLLLTKKNKYTF